VGKQRAQGQYSPEVGDETGREDQLPQVGLTWPEVDLRAWAPLPLCLRPEYPHLPRTINKPNSPWDLSNLAFDVGSISEFEVLRLSEDAGALAGADVSLGPPVGILPYRDDPGFMASPVLGFRYDPTWRLSWCTHADALYDTGIRGLLIIC
jgi:hypothetical protein